MFLLRFLWTALLPRVPVCASAAAVTSEFGEPGGVVALAGIPVAALWTFVAVFGHRSYPRPRPAPPPPPRNAPDKKSLASAGAWAVACVLGVCAGLVGAAAGVVEIQEAAGKRDWRTVGVLVAAIDLLATVLLLWWFNGYESFLRAEAGRAARRFHRAHARLIGDVFPAAVVQAELMSLPADAPPDQVWAKASDLMWRIAEAAKRAREDRARAEEERRASEKAATSEPGYYTPPLPDAGGEPAAAPVDPEPAAREELERQRARVKEEAERLDLPPEIVAAELERIDEEYRKRFGGTR
jgi:hypothetical protein